MVLTFLDNYITTTKIMTYPPLAKDWMLLYKHLSSELFTPWKTTNHFIELTEENFDNFKNLIFSRLFSVIIISDSLIFNYTMYDT